MTTLAEHSRAEHDRELERAVFAWKPGQANPFDEVGPEQRVRMLTRVRWHFAYEVYLHSDAWRRARRAALVRSAGSCERCHCTGPLTALEVHHLTYSHLGDERADELEALCDVCHGVADRERKRTMRRSWWRH